MAVALVGTAGAVSTAAGGSAVTPAWGAGESRTAGNLLICWVLGRAGATAPVTPAGWSVVKQITSATGTGCSVTVFGLIAAGADAAPTIGASAGITWYARLAEFSGAPASVTVDQSGSATSTTSTLIATAGATDAASGELVFTCSGATLSPGAAMTVSESLNNGTLVDLTNTGVSVVGHYCFGYCLATTSNASANANTFTFSVTPVAAATLVVSLKQSAVSAGVPILGRHSSPAQRVVAATGGTF